MTTNRIPVQQNNYVLDEEGTVFASLVALVSLLKASLDAAVKSGNPGITSDFILGVENAVNFLVTLSDDAQEAEGVNKAQWLMGLISKALGSSLTDVTYTSADDTEPLAQWEQDILADVPQAQAEPEQDYFGGLYL